MKLSLKIASTLILSFLVNTSLAQSDSTKKRFPRSIAISSTAGNNFRAIGGQLRSTSTTVDKVITYKSHNRSAGVGWNYRVSADIRLNDWLEARIGFYQVSSDYTELYSSSGLDNGGQPYYTKSSYDYNSSLKAFELGINMVKDLGKWSVYTGADAVFGMDVKRNIVRDYENTGKTTHYESEYQGSKVFGLNHSIGVEFEMTKNLSTIVEINSNWIDYRPDKYLYLDYSKDGVNKMHELTESRKVVLYAEEYEWDYNTLDDNKPSRSPQISIAFGAIGWGVGLKYKLNNSPD
jgi:hypothetical protein